jgi:hypothetical protein
LPQDGGLSDIMKFRREEEPNAPHARGAGNSMKNTINTFVYGMNARLARRKGNVIEENIPFKIR